MFIYECDCGYAARVESRFDGLNNYNVFLDNNDQVLDTCPICDKYTRCWHKTIEDDEIITQVFSAKYDNGGHADYFLSNVGYERFAHLKGVGWLVKGNTHYELGENEFFNTIESTLRDRQAYIEKSNLGDKDKAKLSDKCSVSASKLNDIANLLKWKLSKDFNSPENGKRVKALVRWAIEELS
jgi:hypothetical protein